MKIKKTISVVACDFCNRQESDKLAMYKCIKCGADFCSDCGDIFTGDLGNFGDKISRDEGIKLCKHCIADLLNLSEEEL